MGNEYRPNGIFIWIAFSFIFAFLVLPIEPARADEFTREQAAQLLQSNCFGCHGGQTPQGDMNLSRFEDLELKAEDIEIWQKVLRRVRDGEMPPVFAGPLDEQSKMAFSEWLEKSIQETVCGNGLQPGPSRMRRLNRNEYAATVRDLFGIHFNAAHNLPEDGAGGAGFDNAAETLFISPVHLERYLEAAKEILDYAAKDSKARDSIFIAHPDEQTGEKEAARWILSQFARRAFRRPAIESEVERLMDIYRRSVGRGDPFDTAVFYALQAVLLSPHFLFLVESPNTTGEAQPLGDFELAGRLSYFLWSSMPDEELFQLAKQGQLQKEDVLKEQVERMLQERNISRRSRELEDRKFHAFTESFVSQWLGTRELGRTVKVDRAKYPRYNQELESALQYEPVYVFHEIIDKNESLLRLLDADFTFVNRQLARHYGIIDDVTVENQQLNKVILPKGSHRGGILTMGGVLAVTSYPHRTSPVLRGKWVLESVLGTPPPPPPPNVPPLPENHDSTMPQTVRERLSQHRANPVCASCHDRIDPIGFGLENYDPIGQWRTEEEGKPIDSTGQLLGGKAFNGPDELKQALMEKKDDFIRHITTKMLGYALGRSLVIEDQCTVDQIVERLKADDCKAKTLIWEIVRSVPFRYKRPMEATKPKEEYVEVN